MQGGHHPDLGIDYYEDLFRSIKERYPIHLHVLSPPEIQHIARRSKLTIPQTLTPPPRRRARLDPRRRRRDPRRPGPRRDRSEEDPDRRVAARDARGAPARDLDDRHDDVRPRRGARGPRRAHAPDPRAAGRAAAASAPSSPGRSSRTGTGSRQGAEGADADLVRLPAHAGGLADLPRQRRAHPVVVGDAGDEGRPGRARASGPTTSAR